MKKVSLFLVLVSVYLLGGGGAPLQAAADPLTIVVGPPGSCTIQDSQGNPLVLVENVENATIDATPPQRATEAVLAVQGHLIVTESGFTYCARGPAGAGGDGDDDGDGNEEGCDDDGDEGAGRESLGIVMQESAPGMFTLDVTFNQLHAHVVAEEFGGIVRIMDTSGALDDVKTALFASDFGRSALVDAGRQFLDQREQIAHAVIFARFGEVTLGAVLREDGRLTPNSSVKCHSSSCSVKATCGDGSSQVIDIPQGVKVEIVCGDGSKPRISIIKGTTTISVS